MTMDFRFGPDVEAFREEVRRLLVDGMAPARTAIAGDDGDLTGLAEPFERALQAEAGARGLLGISLPAELGGGGHPASFQAVANLEVAAADAPLIDTAITLAAQPLVLWGSPEHRALVRGMIAGQVEACIAYTEPGAGSDLAAITTVAEPDGDGFVLSGVKSLVTGPHKADWCVTIARTRPDVPARDGLSMFVVDMRAPGLSVRRRRTMNRWTLGDVVFDHVRVGPGALLGRRDGGWRQLVTAVATEGAGMFHVGFARHVLARLTALVAEGAPDDPVARDRLAELAVELSVAERLAKRAVWMEERGEDTTVVASMGKVTATELLQRLAWVATDLAGLDGAIVRPLFGPGSSAEVGDGRFGWEHLERVHGTIGGGTNEVKRTVIAQTGLGLPRPGRS